MSTKELFESIPVGHANAMYVPNRDTEFRSMVKRANLLGEEVIINVGKGYFIVDEEDEEDLALFDEYLARERGRALKMLQKANVMQKTINNQLNK